MEFMLRFSVWTNKVFYTPAIYVSFLILLWKNIFNLDQKRKTLSQLSKILDVHI